MTLESRSRRIEAAVEEAGGSEELTTPTNEEHVLIRQQIRQVEREYAELPPEEDRTREERAREERAQADGLIDRYLILWKLTTGS